MKITYMYHSSFVVELEQHILLFDYFKGKLPLFNPEKKLFVFVSHSHHDHWSKSVFHIDHPDITYILSDDIQYQKDVAIHYVKPHQNMMIEDINVSTLRSTDQGVAFLLHVEDQCIYHAGDLNWWDWGEEDTPQESNAMETAYCKEIDALKQEMIDIAFVPLDPRLETNFYKGLDYFMRHTRTNIVYPMHMWDNDTVIQQLKALDISSPYRDKVMDIQVPGQVFNLKRTIPNIVCI